MVNNIDNFKAIDNYEKYFKIYLISLFFLGIYYLHYKHNAGTDSSISEYLINYQGGFNRRGLIGEICFIIADFFDLKLRFVIFIFQ